MILLRRCDVNSFIGVQPVISVEYEVHGIETNSHSIKCIEKQICNDLITKIYGVTMEDMKEMFPEKFI